MLIRQCNEEDLEKLKILSIRLLMKHLDHKIKMKILIII